MRRSLWLVGWCLLSLSLSGAEEAASVSPAGQEDAPNAPKRPGPMDLEGVDSQLASILQRYYRSSFGGEDNWKEIESLKFNGTLRLPEGELRFGAFKKKPNLCKIAINASNGVQVVMGFDGRDVWMVNPALGPDPRDMGEKEALNFIRDAETGGHLLYPTLPGKTIQLLGTRRVGDLLCYELLVTLPDGLEITYVIDVQHFKERQQILVNAVNGDREVITHGAHKVVEGISIPFQSTMTVNDEFVHEIVLDRVLINRGVMPWMFERPAPRLAPVNQGGNSSSSADPGEAASTAESVFPDLDPNETENILEDLGKPL